MAARVFERHEIGLVDKVIARVESGLLAQPLLQEDVAARLTGSIQLVP
jgi:hypothetical protein